MIKGRNLGLPLATFSLMPVVPIASGAPLPAGCMQMHVGQQQQQLCLGEMRGGERTIVLGVNSPEVRERAKVKLAEAAVWGVMDHDDSVPAAAGLNISLNVQSPEIVWDLMSANPAQHLEAAKATRENHLKHAGSDMASQYVDESQLQMWYNKQQTSADTCAVGSWSIDTEDNKKLKFAPLVPKPAGATCFVALDLDMTHKAGATAAAAAAFVEQVRNFFATTYHPKMLNGRNRMRRLLQSKKKEAFEDKHPHSDARLILRTHLVMAVSAFPEDNPQEPRDIQTAPLMLLMLLIAIDGVQNDHQLTKGSPEEIDQLSPTLADLVGSVVDFFRRLMTLFPDVKSANVHKQVCEPFASHLPAILAAFSATSSQKKTDEAARVALERILKSAKNANGTLELTVPCLCKDTHIDIKQQ